MPAVLINQKWTYERMLAELPSGSRYELINDELIPMSPSPKNIHQEISHEFDFQLTSYVKKTKVGKVFTAPFDVVLDNQTVVEPDILFIKTENLGIIKGHVHGVPDLIVEVVSPSSIFRDYYEKKNLYERFGVAEYWIINPANENITVFKLVDSVYTLHAEVSEEGSISSNLLPDFEVNLSDIFQK